MPPEAAGGDPCGGQVTNLAPRDLTVDLHVLDGKRARLLTQLPPPPPPDSPCYHYAHGANWSDWRAVVGALQSINSRAGLASMIAVESCGSDAIVQYSPSTGRYRIALQRCGRRVCPHCGGVIAAETQARVREWMGTIKPYTWRMVTLSMRSSSGDLREAIKLLKASFRRLRQTQIWSTTQHYGIAVVECTYNREADSWHPHLHVLMRGRYIPIEALRAAWWSAAHEGARVHICPVDSATRAANYVAKYVGKSLSIKHESPTVEGGYDCDADQSLASLPERRLREWCNALYRDRWMIRVGDAPPLPDAPPPEGDDADPGDWEWQGTLDGMIARAYADDCEAIDALDSCWPGWRDHTTRGAPDANHSC